MLAHLVVSLALSSLVAVEAGDPVRGCGVMIDDQGIGHTTLSDEQCRGVGGKVKSVSIGEGCVCVGFRKAGCSMDDSKAWASVAIGPQVGKDFSHLQPEWLRCSTDANWAQGWFDKFAAAVDKNPWQVPRDGDRILSWREANP